MTLVVDNGQAVFENRMKLWGDFERNWRISWIFW